MVQRLSILGLGIAAVGLWAALESPAAAQGCSRSRPQFGILQLNGPGPVRVNRNGHPLSLGTGALMCVADRLPASPRSGEIVGPGGNRVTIHPQRETVVPDRSGLLAWLGLGSFRDYWFENAGTAGTPMSLGDRGFLLGGMEDGSAVVSRGARSIIIPLRPGSLPQRVALWPPGARAPLAAVTLPAGERDVRFSDLPRRAGDWRVVIDGDGPVGGFRMEEGTADDPVRNALRNHSLSDREMALARACFDPAGNGLDAYQHLLSEADRLRVLRWQHPSEILGCTAPGED